METMRALDHLVRQGKALYVGISNYPLAQAREAVKILNDLGTPASSTSLATRCSNAAWKKDCWIFCRRKGLKHSVFTAGRRATYRPLSQRHSGRLARRQQQSFSAAGATDSCPIRKIRQLNRQAEARGQKLSQMALAWVLREEKVTSVLIGASKTTQLDDAVGMLQNRHFTTEECAAIDAILAL